MEPRRIVGTAGPVQRRSLMSISGGPQLAALLRTPNHGCKVRTEIVTGASVTKMWRTGGPRRVCSRDWQHLLKRRCMDASTVIGFR